MINGISIRELHAINKVANTTSLEAEMQTKTNQFQLDKLLVA